MYLQWFQWLLKTALRDENVLIINIDETSIQNDYLQRKGYVVEMSGAERTAAGCFFQRVGMSETRSHITLVAAISARPGVQAMLPQIIIPNDTRITRAERAKYQELGAPLEIITGEHGWVNASVMKNLITRYRRAVRDIDPAARLVLLMDSASQHISNDVLRHAQSLNVVLILIPGKLTWLLQPLDVSVFRVFKDVLKTSLLRHRMGSDSGTITMEDRIRILGETISSVLVHRDWSDCFPKVGASLQLDNLRSTLTRILPDASAIQAQQCTLDELADLVGRHRLDIDTRVYRAPLRIMDQRAAAEALPALPPAAPPELPPPLQENDSQSAYPRAQPLPPSRRARTGTSSQLDSSGAM